MDIIIRNGNVVDGTLAPMFVGDGELAPNVLFGPRQLSQKRRLRPHRSIGSPHARTC